jgi:hypothetical protein
VPTTLPGLFALLIYMAEAHSYDAEVMAEHHIEPLILGLGAAARTLSGAVQS